MLCGIWTCDMDIYKGMTWFCLGHCRTTAKNRKMHNIVLEAIMDQRKFS